ncbi:MAG: CHAT domain-containing protein, partial [Bacteroidota bacterium]
NDLVYLGNRDTINGAIKNWKERLITQDDKSLKLFAESLYQKLWFPVVEKLMGERVIIVPCGSLFYLNWETLPSNNDTGTFLIHEYNISYALSFNILFSDNNKTSQGDIIAVAPGFEEDIKQQYQTQLDSLTTPDEEFLLTVRQPWSLKLASHLEKEFTSTSYTGIKATEVNVKASIQEGSILYFGTHAIANATDPLRSKLVLAKEIGTQKEDGYLHAYELYGLPLQAELAVLNACESGLGNLQAGEGMISLAYSIHYAGCPSTIMSLWKVDEKISTQITKDFLNYLAEGYSKSEALRQAKLDYLNAAQPNTAAPFYWGGMVLMGEDGEVSFQHKNRDWYIYVGLTLIIILFLYFGRNRIKK